MTMENVKSIGFGGQHLNDTLPRAIAELQGLTISGPLAGANAATNIPVTEGIDLQDTGLKALMFAAGVPSDITSTMSINDVRPAGTMTVVAGLADGDTCQVNGKTYTAKSVSPTNSNRGIGVQQFSSGKQADGSTVLTVNQILALNMTLFPANGIGAAPVLTTAQATTLQAAGVLAIAALSLANAINSADSLILTATVSAALNSAIVNVFADAESTAGNSVALGTTGGNAHYTASGGTLSGGLSGTPYGTLTLAAVVATNTVTVNGTVFTAVASTVTPALGQFAALASGDITVGAVCNAQTRLMEAGLSMGQAQAILTAATTAVANNATAYLLARAINNAMGATVSATIPAASAVITLNAADGSGTSYTLAQAGGTVTLSGGNFTASSRGVKFSGSTSGNTVVVFWYKKSRLLTQA